MKYTLLQKMLSGVVMLGVLFIYSMIMSPFAYAQQNDTSSEQEVAEQSGDTEVENDEVETTEVDEDEDVDEETEENDVELITKKINELMLKHTELKAKVDSGEITKKEAQAEWKTLVDNLRKEKEDRFARRLRRIKERAEKIKSLAPEQIGVIMDRIAEMQKRNTKYQQERLEIRNKLKNQEITREEARDLQKEIIDEHKKEMGEKRGEFKEAMDLLKGKKDKAIKSGDNEGIDDNNEEEVGEENEDTEEETSEDEQE